MKILKCLRCGHGENENNPWIQRGLHPPKFCWKCHSPYWMRPRIRINKEPAQNSIESESAPNID